MEGLDNSTLTHEPQANYQRMDSMLDEHVIYNT
jgi:hypothetical protein